jgi:hypothetical protein
VSCCSIARRECIGYLNQATSFTLDPLAPSGLAVNPGCEATFPWLSQVANNFEQYKFHFLRFIYKSTTANSVQAAATNNNLGVMIYQMTYDVYDAVPSSRLEMTNYYGTKRARPCDDFALDVNVVSNHTDLFYVRSGSATSTVQGDKRLYDIGTFFIASDGASASGNCGELWVEYSVMFYKPKLYDSLGYGVSGFSGYRNGVTNTAWTGGGTMNTYNVNGNTLGVTMVNLSGVDDGLSIRIPPTNDARSYLLNYNWSGTGVAWAPPAVAYSNCSEIHKDVGYTSGLAAQTAAGISVVIKVITPGQACYILFTTATGVAFVGTSNFVLKITEIDYNTQ